MKKVTFNLAIGKLSRATSSFALDTKVFSVPDVHVVIDVEMSFWLLTLTQRYSDLLELKQDKFIAMQIENLESKLSELGLVLDHAVDPFAELVTKKAMIAGEAVSALGHSSKCIEVAVVPEMIMTVVNYEFFKKLRTKSPDLFTGPEAAMTEYARKFKLPLRLTSNAFLTDEEKAKRNSKEKKQANFELLRKFVCNADSIAY